MSRSGKMIPKDLTDELGLPARRRHVDKGNSEGNGSSPTPPTLPTLPLYSSETLRFPVEVLPKVLQQLVTEASASIGCEPEMIGVPALPILASAVGMSRQIQVKGGWTESTAIWTGIVAGSADKKTPAFNVATAPAWRHQEKLDADYQRKTDQYKVDMRAHKADCQVLDKSEPEPPPPEPPTPGECITDDHTMESLIQLLHDNPRGIVNVRDELPAVVTSLNQYKGGQGSDREHLLKIHSNSAVKINRLGRRVTAPKPYMTICGGIQPAKVADFVAGKDGLMERFLLARPDTVRREVTRHELSDDTREAYAKLYEALNSLAAPTDDEGKQYPRKVPMGDGAFDRFVERSAELVAEINHPGFPPRLERLWGKMEAYLLRLALLLCLCRTVEQGHDTTKEEVLVEDLHRAWRLVRYFCAQSIKVYDGVKSSRLEDLEADLLALAFEDGGILELSASDLFDNLKSRGSTALPGDAGQLSAELLRVAQESPRVQIERGYKGKGRILRVMLTTSNPESESLRDLEVEKENSRISYRNSVGSVGSVGETSNGRSRTNADVVEENEAETVGGEDLTPRERARRLRDRERAAEEEVEPEGTA